MYFKCQLIIENKFIFVDLVGCFLQMLSVKLNIEGKEQFLKFTKK